MRAIMEPGHVVASADMDWAGLPTVIGDACKAPQSAAVLADQWTERDQRIADLMRLRRENSYLWYDGVASVVSAFRGVLQTPSVKEELLRAIRHKRDELVARFGGSEIPEFVLRYQGDSIIVEPNWEGMPRFRWREPS